MNMRNGDVANENSGGSRSGSAPTPCKNPNCRARRLDGRQEFSECLVSIMTPCEFGLYCDEGRLCGHPEHDFIAARSELATQKAEVAILVQAESAVLAQANARQ